MMTKKSADLIPQDDEILNKSKSQIKRELNELHALGEQLVGLPDSHLHQVVASEKLNKAIIDAKKMKLTALKRQLKFIAALLRQEDEAAIRLALKRLKKSHQQQVAQFHQIEQWRDALLDNDEKTIEQLANTFEHFNRQYVRQLIRNTKKEVHNNKSVKSARLLFSYLSELKNEQSDSK